MEISRYKWATETSGAYDKAHHAILGKGFSLGQREGESISRECQTAPDLRIRSLQCLFCATKAFMSHLCCLFPVGAASVGELSLKVICEAWEPEGSR